MHDSILFNILKINRLFNTYRRMQLKDTDLNPALYVYISYAYHNPGCKADDFVNKFYLDKTTVAHQLNHLEKNDFIYRQTSSDDGRCRHIYLTDKSLALYPILHQSLEDFSENIYKGLTNDEKELLKSISEKMIVNGVEMIQR